MAGESKMPVIRHQQKRKRTSRRLLYFLFAFFLVLLVILFFQSSLSKVASIEITGNVLLSESAIAEASQVKAGDRFFGVRSGSVESLVKMLDIIDSVEVKKTFPGLIKIQVKEHPRVAFLVTSSGQEVLLANGIAIPSAQADTRLDMPILRGWEDNVSLRAELCRHLAQIPVPLLSDISEIIPDPSASYPDKIKIYTRSQYEVYSTVSELPEKIKYLQMIIDKLKAEDKQTGVIKLLETNVYSPFDSVESEEQDNP